MQQADYAAWNVRAALRDEPHKMMPFRYADLGEMLSLGDSAGSMSSLGLINLQVRAHARTHARTHVSCASSRTPHRCRVPQPRHKASVLVVLTYLLTYLINPNMQGPLASLGRRAVYAARMPTTQQAARAGLSWAVDSVVGAMMRGGAKKE